MKNSCTALMVTILLASCSHKMSQPSTPVKAADGFETEPAWVENFDKDGAPDPASWGYDLGNDGWGNNELQDYTNHISNATVKNGFLYINAIKENNKDSKYTSARLVTKSKKDFLYGRIAVRAKLPEGAGTWPAIWMLPTDWAYGDWPRSGEIDIMEHVGKDPYKVHFSVHTESYHHSINTQKTAIRNIPTAISAFHVYRVDWTPQSIKGYFDDVLMFSFDNDQKRDYKTWPFDKKFHVLLNVAIGGNWGGPVIDDTKLPATMVVDYIKYYPYKF